MEKEKIVFFDGVCNLCTFSVQFLLKFNKKQNLQFAPLQSEFVRSRFPEEFNRVSTILYLDEGELYRESTAVLKITKELVFPLSLFRTLLLIPEVIRDFFYRLLAQRRYLIFGKSEVCFLPTPELEKRFLK